nr:ABC transporter E family member 2 [Tanacetum cinerariifolium]
MFSDRGRLYQRPEDVGETEIKDDDAYKEEILDYEEGDDKAPYSTTMSANKNSIRRIRATHLCSISGSPYCILHDKSNAVWSCGY